MDYIVATASLIVLVVWVCFRVYQVRNFGRYPKKKLPLKRYESSFATFDRVVAITGGSGFLGRRIISMLLEQQPRTKVVVIDLLVPKQRHPRVEYVRASITDRNQLLDALSHPSRTVDCVMHTARCTIN